MNDGTSALIIIDMTTPIPEEWSHQQAAHNRLITKISTLIRQWNGPVILANYGVDEPKSIHNHIPRIQLEVAQKPRHFVSTDRDKVISYLNINKIKDVYYVGQSMPGCVIFRPLGYKSMKEEGFNCTVLPKYTEHVCGYELNLEDTVHETYKFILGNNINIEYM